MTAAELGHISALTSAKARYCRLLDTKDWASLAGLMTPDVTLCMGDDATEPQVTVGRDKTVDVLRTLIGDACTAHHVHNPEIDVRDNEASVIWAVHDRAVFANGTSVTGYGHYYERWVCTDGSWKLASLRLVHLITDITRS